MPFHILQYHAIPGHGIPLVELSDVPGTARLSCIHPVSGRPVSSTPFKPYRDHHDLAALEDLLKIQSFVNQELIFVIVTQTSPTPNPQKYKKRSKMAKTPQKCAKVQ